jgi:integrase
LRSLSAARRRQKAIIRPRPEGLRKLLKRNRPSLGNFPFQKSKIVNHQSPGDIAFESSSNAELVHADLTENPVFGVKLRKTGTRIPVVLSEPETQEVFGQLSVPGGRYELAARLQYGAGLRRSELVRLRVKDVDLDRGILTVRQGKGDKDRNTILPQSLREELAKQIERAREVWRRDREAELAGVGDASPRTGHGPADDPGIAGA